jgi:hypothetical protein
MSSYLYSISQPTQAEAFMHDLYYPLNRNTVPNQSSTNLTQFRGNKNEPNFAQKNPFITTNLTPNPNFSQSASSTLSRASEYSPYSNHPQFPYNHHENSHPLPMANKIRTFSSDLFPLFLIKMSILTFGVEFFNSGQTFSTSLSTLSHCPTYLYYSHFENLHKMVFKWGVGFIEGLNEAFKKGENWSEKMGEKTIPITSLPSHRNDINCQYIDTVGLRDIVLYPLKAANNGYAQHTTRNNHYDENEQNILTNIINNFQIIDPKTLSADSNTQYNPNYPLFTSNPDLLYGCHYDTTSTLQPLPVYAKTSLNSLPLIGQNLSKYEKNIQIPTLFSFSPQCLTPPPHHTHPNFLSYCQQPQPISASLAHVNDTHNDMTDTNPTNPTNPPPQSYSTIYNHTKSTITTISQMIFILQKDSFIIGKKYRPMLITDNFTLLFLLAKNRLSTTQQYNSEHFKSLSLTSDAFLPIGNIYVDKLIHNNQFTLNYCQDYLKSQQQALRQHVRPPQKQQPGIPQPVSLIDTYLNGTKPVFPKPFSYINRSYSYQASPDESIASLYWGDQQWVHSRQGEVARIELGKILGNFQTFSSGGSSALQSSCYSIDNIDQYVRMPCCTLNDFRLYQQQNLPGFVLSGNLENCDEKKITQNKFENNSNWFSSLFFDPKESFIECDSLLPLHRWKVSPTIQNVIPVMDTIMTNYLRRFKY